MKILVVGAGAVGGYFGGRLALAGNDVTFLARGRRLELLNNAGLSVESIAGNFTLDTAAATDKPKGVFDLILVAVKEFDLKKVIGAIEKNVSSGTTLLSLLNGIESENTLSAAFGAEKVIGGVAFIGSALLDNGVIRHTAAGSVIIGELAGGKSARCCEIKRIFSGSGVKCKISESIKNDIWAKMIWNTGFNAVTAITGAGVSEVTDNEETKCLIADAMEETRRVSFAEDAALPDNIVSDCVEKSRNAHGIRTSMLQDLERGDKTEVKTLNGAVVRLGEKHGIPVPVNRTLLRLVLFKEMTRFKAE